MTETGQEPHDLADEGACEVCGAEATRVLVVLIREPVAHVVEGPVCEDHWHDAEAVAESWGDAIASRPPS